MGLRRWDRVTVVPVLVDAAEFPRAAAVPPALRDLAGYQTERLRRTHLAGDIKHLIARLAEIAASYHTAEPGPDMPGMSAPSVREVDKGGVRGPALPAAPGQADPGTREPGGVSAPDGPATIRTRRLTLRPTVQRLFPHCVFPHCLRKPPRAQARLAPLRLRRPPDPRVHRVPRLMPVRKRGASRTPDAVFREHGSIQWLPSLTTRYAGLLKRP